jgi:putative oxidoreductase
MHSLKKLYARFCVNCSRFSWLGPLLARLVIGMVFATFGFKKLADLAGAAAYFEHLGIPFPQFQAPFVGCIEAFGGIAMLIGLGTRLVCLPFIIIMIVAMLTAKAKDVHGLMSVLNSANFLFIVLLIWLMVNGAGRLSLDKYKTKTN